MAKRILKLSANIFQLSTIFHLDFVLAIASLSAQGVTHQKSQNDNTSPYNNKDNLAAVRKFADRLFRLKTVRQEQAKCVNVVWLSFLFDREPNTSTLQNSQTLNTLYLLRMNWQPESSWH